MPRKPADFTLNMGDIVREVERKNRYTGMLDLYLSDMLKTYRGLLDSIEELDADGTARLAKIEAEFSEIEAQASERERERYTPIFQEFETIKRCVQ